MILPESLVPEIFAGQQSCAELGRVSDQAPIERPRIPGEVGGRAAVPARGLSQDMVQSCLHCQDAKALWVMRPVQVVRPPCCGREGRWHSGYDAVLLCQNQWHRRDRDRVNDLLRPQGRR